MSRSTARPSKRSSSLVTLSAALLATSLHPAAASAGFTSIRDELVYLQPNYYSSNQYFWNYIETCHEDITIHNWSSYTVMGWAIRKYVNATPEDLVSPYPNADGTAIVSHDTNMPNSMGYGSFGYALSPLQADLEPGEMARGHAWAWLFGEESAATASTTTRSVDQEHEVTNGAVLADMHWWLEIYCNDRTFVVESEVLDYVAMSHKQERTGSRALIVTDEMCEDTKETYTDKLGHYSDGDDVSNRYFPENRYGHDRALFKSWSNTDTKGNKFDDSESEGALQAAILLAYPDHGWQSTDCGEDAVAARTIFKADVFGFPLTEKIDHYRAHGVSKASSWGMKVVVFGAGDTITCDDTAGFGVDCEDNLKRRYFCPQA